MNRPTTLDKYNTLRFKQNAIVRYLLDKSDTKFGLLMKMDFTDEDRREFCQLIGFSVDLYQQLSFVSNNE